MPPVLGPVSPSPTHLWSCAPATGIAVCRPPCVCQWERGSAREREREREREWEREGV